MRGQQVPLPEMPDWERRVLHSNQDSALIQIQHAVLFFKDLEVETTSTWTHIHGPAHPEFRVFVFWWGEKKSLLCLNEVSPNPWEDTVVMNASQGGLQVPLELQKNFSAAQTKLKELIVFMFVFLSFLWHVLLIPIYNDVRILENCQTG